MRYTQAEKLEIIHLVETSDQPVKRTLAELGVPRSTFYRWYARYRIAGAAGLADQSHGPRRFWNRIPDAAGANRAIVVPDSVSPAVQYFPFKILVVPEFPGVTQEALDMHAVAGENGLYLHNGPTLNGKR